MNLASSETATSNQVFSYPINKQSSYQMELDHGRQEQQPTTNDSSTTGQSYNSINPTTAPLPSLSSLSLSNQYPSFKKGDTNNEQKQSNAVPILNPTPIHSNYPAFSNSPPVRSMSPSLQQQQQQGPVGYHAVHRFAPIYSYNQPSNMMNHASNASSKQFSAPPYYAPPPPFYYPPMPYPIHEAAPPPMLFATTGSPMLSSPSIRSTSPDKSSNSGSNSSNTSASNNTVKPPHPNSKRKKKLSKDEILKYIQYPQPDAARMLNVSVSTLKRRFYELGLGRWPYPTTHLPSQSGGYSRSGTSSGNNSNRSSGKFEPISMEDESSQPMDSDQSNTSAEDEDDNMGSAENAKESNSVLNPGTTEASLQQNASGILLSSSANPRETLLNRDPLRVSPNQPPLFIHSTIIPSNQQNTYKDGGATTGNILQVIHKSNNSEALKNKMTQSEILKKKFGEVVRLQTESENEKSSTLENLKHQAFSQPEVATPRTKLSINWLSNDKTGVTTPEAKMVNRETIEALKNSF